VADHAVATAVWGKPSNKGQSRTGHRDVANINKSVHVMREDIDV